MNDPLDSKPRILMTPDQTQSQAQQMEVDKLSSKGETITYYERRFYYIKGHSRSLLSLNFFLFLVKFII